MENESKKLLEFLRFPGILLLGLFIFLVSVLLYKRWESLLNMMSLAAIGVLLVFIGITLYFKSLNKVSVCGFILYLLSIIIFYFFEKYITDIVATLYASSIIVLLLSIIMAVNKPFPPPLIKTPIPEDEIPMRDRIDLEIGNQWQKLRELHELYQGSKMDSEMEIQKTKVQRNKYLLNIIDTCESLNKLLSGYKGVETDEIKAIRMMHNEIREELEDAKIKRMMTNERDIVDVYKHIIINEDEVPRNWPARSDPKIKRVNKDGYLLGSEVFRKAEVEADWCLKEDKGEF